jgi:aflatoxin B1 aldehyde reductase
MTFGSSGEGSRIHDQAQVEELLTHFKNEGYSELDTARMYCEGNTEIVIF